MGFKIDQITRIFESRGFHAGIGIPVLIERSLISVSRDQVWMHNLLQIMGKEIVRYESPEELGRRSRLWTYEDVCLALMDSSGKEKIEAIFLDMPGIKEAQWNMQAFSKMSNLRLLKIENVQLSEGPEDLSNKLRFLEWHSYPSKSLPTGLQVDELVELHMANNSIEQLWYGCKSAVNLKIINLSNSLNMSKTPDLIGIPNLKSLILEGCTSLSKVHPSLSHNNKLQYVNLVNCARIRILPNNLEMESLKVCTLDGCSKLEKFPDIVGNMNCLMVLCLDETEVLGLRSCNLREGALPEDIGWLSSLRSLDLSQNNFVSLPKNIIRLSELEMLVLEDCMMLESLPQVPYKVQTIYLNGSISLKTIPDPINLRGSKRSDFICLNCWELYNHNGQDSMGLAMLESYREGWSHPRPRFGIVVPGNEIPGWFNHQSKGSLNSVQVPSWSMGFVACVAFSVNGESPSPFVISKSMEERIILRR
ncbi:disease resistance protein RUN1-like [Populus alba x Populus x berolinensis]|nr:disease resistance protein RUN1-like [Populus alba x Populus x berolinensis]